MKTYVKWSWVLLLAAQTQYAQTLPSNPISRHAVIEQIAQESQSLGQLENLAHELLDEIGPRLVGSPEMETANHWAVNKMKSWDIEAYNQEFGTWKGWQRGITHVDMTYPRVKTLQATQLAWSPATRKPVEAEVVVFPVFNNATELQNWLKNLKGKVVLLAPYQISGRPDYQLKEYATPVTYDKLKTEKEAVVNRFNESIKNTGYTLATLPEAIEKAGAAGIIVSNWTGIMGANRIFGAKTVAIPTIDMEIEDFGMLYRLSLNGKKPKIKMDVQSKKLPDAKSFNTIGIIKGKEKPEEYIVLSAHLDSWDGAQGATDNGTGVITMLEVARILKKVYPNNKRSIVIGLWGSEEQGLNGSRAFVKDNPELVKGIQAVFNQDSGTGRITSISGQGFRDAYDFLGRWLQAVPQDIRRHITTDFPGMPGNGGSDHASFVAAGVPAMYLGSLSWDYGAYTWHTNRDTYDKIVFDEVRNNVVLIAALTYMASEDETGVSKIQRILPVNEEGAQTSWPEVKEPRRTSEGY